MRSAFYIILNLTENILMGCFIVFLANGLLYPKKKFNARVKRLVPGIIMLQFAVVQMCLIYLPALKKLLYGEHMQPKSSVSGAVMLCTSVFITFVFFVVLYDGSWRKMGYLILVFYTVKELVRFLIKPIFSGFITIAANWINAEVTKNNLFVMDQMYPIYSLLEMSSEISAAIAICYLMFKMLKLVRRKLSVLFLHLSIPEIILLAVQAAVGLGFCILMRIIIYSVDSSGVHYLLDEYPQTYVMIPVITAFCLISMVLGMITLEQVRAGNEQELKVKVYQNQVSEMEEHIRDVEHLYDGIRGMKHDMKNCIADMDALLRSREGKEPAGLRQYLDGLCQTVEQFDFKCSTGNPVTDIIISRWMREAKEQGIPLECSFLYPKNTEFSVFDLSVIINNALENAVEASLMEGKDAKIEIESYGKENMYFIEVRNHFTKELSVYSDGRTLISVKEDKNTHGLGMQNIEKSAEKYFGRTEYRIEEQEFILTVMLQKKNC